MLQFLRVRQGRRAAVAAVAPYVEMSRLRLQQIPEGIWLDPYMIGFIAMLITLIAKRAAGPLGMQAMGLVQAEAWADITGLKADIGEELCLLSTARDPHFATGCRNAAAFVAALYGDYAGDETVEWARSVELGDATEPAAELLIEASGDASTLWSLFFDSRIT